MNSETLTEIIYRALALNPNIWEMDFADDPNIIYLKNKTENKHFKITVSQD